MIPYRKFICRVCGWIYDEALGDPDGGLPPGTRFDDIPDDWACPLCGVTKADFEPYVLPAAAVASVATPDISVTARSIWDAVIVGGGTAGWAVAERLRALSPSARIALVTGCAGDLYAKPQLSVALSRKLDATSLCRGQGADTAAGMGITLMGGTFASGIDPHAHRLRTTQGTLRYGALVLAQGAQPVRLSSLPTDLVWRVNSLSAWLRLRQSIGDTPRRIVLVGAGLVGCELAEDAAEAGHTVTLIGRGPYPLDGLVPPEAGRRISARLEHAGIHVMNDTVVHNVTRSERTMKVNVVTSGRPALCAADIVIAAIGLETNLHLAHTAGLDTDTGIMVDPATLRTSQADIYALGDCITIHGQPCRYIGPIAAQADTIAHEILGLRHGGYAHQPPKVRLKSRVAPLELSGTPDPAAPWEVVTDTTERLVMQQRCGCTTTARLEVS